MSNSPFVTSVNVLARRLAVTVGLLLLVFGIGTYGFVVIEKWDFLDSLWMVVITLTTVGYGEIHTLSRAGRIFTIVLLLAGMGILVYGVSTLTAFVVEGQLHDILRRRKMRKRIGKTTGHTIVCGAGRVGSHVIRELEAVKEPFVVIERDHRKAETLRERGLRVVEADATHEGALNEAGVARAARLVSCLSDDRDNLFVVLTARGCNSKMRIVTRYFEEKSADKFRRAGADAMVSPDAIGGLRIASETLRPTVVSFLDKMLRSNQGVLRVAEVTARAGGSITGGSLEEAKVAERTGVLVVAMKKEDGDYLFNPPAKTRIEPGVTLIVMGELKSVEKLKGLAGEKKPA